MRALHARDGEGRRSRQGTTMVEVLFACTVLSIVVVGTGAYVTHARADVVTQQGRRLAIEAAAARMEHIRRSDYGDIAPALVTNVYFMSVQTGLWVHASSDPGETVDLNGRPFPISTTVQYRDVDGGSQSFDYLHVAVSTGYRRGRADRVRIESYFSF